MTRRLPIWGWWSIGIIILSLPWVGFATRPQWNRVHLVPFTDPEDSPRDLALNVGVFVPFGFWFVTGRRRSGVASTAAAAALVSIAAETPQLFSTMRDPSATDVLYAVAGSTIGATIGALARPRPRP
jgi:glycopeptide antibiotics resistance protein